MLHTISSEFGAKMKLLLSCSAALYLYMLGGFPFLRCRDEGVFWKTKEAEVVGKGNRAYLLTPYLHCS